jgi:excinuclease ABC subunit A
VRLGQPATTLSGGEAQRVKLASELQKRSNGRSIYVLDEPTTGLHFEDIRKLLLVLQGLVDKGNSVIVIEHNLDVIKTADWVIDMGPEGGNKGGQLVAIGTPEEVAEIVESHTGGYLRRVLGLRGQPAGGSALARAQKANGKANGNGNGKATANATAIAAPTANATPTANAKPATNGKVPAKATAAKATAGKATAGKATAAKATAGKATAAKATAAKAATSTRRTRQAPASR